jgi:acyl dehydratase
VASYPVTQEAIVRYAGASGDFTAFHYDRRKLPATGYDEFFAMGMLVAGHLGALVTSTFGDESIREFRTRFLSPSFVGRTVTCTMSRHPGEGRPGTVTVDLVANDDLGATVAIGQAVVVP